MSPRSVLALPSPALLVWARESIGLDQESVAGKLKVEVASVRAWESGTERPSLAQLRRLAEICKRPLAVFYLPERPRDFQPLRDFRHGSDGAKHHLSPNVAMAIRKAQDRRDWALELYDLLQQKPPRFEGALSGDDAVEAAASKVRHVLRIRFETQTQWRLDYEALRNWRATIEATGVLTFQATDLDTKEARGFSISESPLPVAVSNVRDAPRGRIFTLLHEFVHVMLHEGGICDIAEERRPNAPNAKTEMFCNQVAGAVLFPLQEFLASNVLRLHRKGDPRWTDIELQELSRSFGGSREAALVRLLGLHLTTWDYYLERREEFYRKYQAAKEKSSGFAAPHTVAVSNAGPTFTRLVLEGLNRNRISTSDFSDYLQIRVKHLSEVKQEISTLGSKG